MQKVGTARPGPPEKPAEATSSIVSKITPKSLKASIKTIKDGLKKLGDSSSDLSYAVKDAGGGPWEGWRGLVEAERKKQLDDP